MDIGCVYTVDTYFQVDKPFSSATEIPFGISIIITVLEQHGHNVELIVITPETDLETTVSNSVGLFPREERDFFDMIWVLIWDSKEKRERGWKEWIEGPAEEWVKKTNSILSCGAATNGTVRNYAFDVSSYRTVSQDPEPGGVTGFTYCTYTEDYGKAELLKSLNEFNGWLDGFDTPEGGSTYFYTIQEPLFERPIEGSDLTYDYAFHHFWDSEESRNIGSNLFAQTVPVDPDIVTPDCSEMFLYDSYPFRY